MRLGYSATTSNLPSHLRLSSRKSTAHFSCRGWVYDAVLLQFEEVSAVMPVEQSGMVIDLPVADQFCCILLF